MENRIDWNRYKINRDGYLVDLETGEVVTLYEYDYSEPIPTSLVEAVGITLASVF